MLFSFLKIKNSNQKLINFTKNKIKSKYNKEFYCFLNTAQAKLEEHKLGDWEIGFDHSKRRAGVCFFCKKLISFSVHFLRKASKLEINDTLLHEIAHALVGPNNAHNEIWKKKAIEVGCTGKIYHEIQFCKPTWIKLCSNGCWEQECFRKKKHLICKFCKAKVIFKKNN